MKNLKKLTFGLVALVMAFGLVFSVSAFKSKSSTKRTPVYFKYTGSNFNETAYRNISNWEQTTAPEEEACFGNTNICILKVDTENLSGPGATMLDKLDHFLNTDLDGSGEVASYVNDDDNREAEQN